MPFLTRILLAIVAAMWLSSSLGAPGPFPEEVVHVAAASATSADATGTQRSPYPTIGQGLEHALRNRRLGVATRILIQPGVYRESLAGAFPELGEAPISFDAAVSGTVVISGADVWSDWACEEAGCWHAWPFDWGVDTNPWPQNVTIGELALRRELVIVDGQNLTPVGALSELSPGTFYVDESNDRLWALGPGGRSLDTALVEVGVRETLIRLQGLNDLAFRGLVVTAAASPFRHAAFDVVDQERVRIENVSVIANGQVGLSLKGIDIVVSGAELSNNGSSGVTAYQVDRVEISSTRAANNNWRGVLGGYDSWEVGQKFSSAHNVLIRDFTAVNNASRGLWFDADVKNVIVDTVYLCGNARDGLFLEAIQGPVRVTNSLICDNGHAGILTSTSENIELSGNVIRGNETAQLSLSGQLERRVLNWRSHESEVVALRNWLVTGNTLIADGEQMLVTTTLPVRYWDTLMRSSHFAGNRYVQPVLESAFQLPNGRRADFAGWVNATGEEADSVFSTTD